MRSIALREKRTKGDIQNVTRIIPYKQDSAGLSSKLVVTEDDYTDMLRIVIEQEFFPDLLRFKLANGNNKPVFRRVIKLTDGQKVEVDLAQLTLGEFQAVLTSEDNTAFEELVRVEKQRLALEQSWMESAALLHNTQNQERLLAVEQGKPVDGLIYSDAVPRNTLMFQGQDRPIYSIRRVVGEETKLATTTISSKHGTERQLTYKERQLQIASNALETLHDDVIAIAAACEPANAQDSKKRMVSDNTRITHTQAQLDMLAELGRKRLKTDGGGGFRIPEAPRREIIARQLRESVVRRDGIQQREVLATPGLLKAAVTPGSNLFGRLGGPASAKIGLSPARLGSARPGLTGIEILRKYRDSKRTPSLIRSTSH